MNRMKCGFYTYRGIAFCFVAAMFCGQTMAQVVEKRGFDSQKKINAFDNTTFCTAYLSDGALYTMRDIAINDVRKIERIVFNPTGSSIALLRAKNPISIYSFRDRNKKLFELKEKRKKLKAKPMPVSMCYSADARSFIVGNSLGEIVIYDTKEYMPLAYIQGEAPATALAMSSNNYFIAAAAGQNINIWNFQTKELRKAIPMPAVVKEVTFSPDAALLAVTTDDNHLTIIDTKNWDKVDIFDKLGGTLSSPSFHPEGKYISVVKDGKNIEIINLKNGVVEQEKKVKLPMRYNTLSIYFYATYEQVLKIRRSKSQDFYSKEEFSEAISNPGLVHFTTCFLDGLRPWIKGNQHPYLKTFLKYKEMSPWRDIPLQEDKRSGLVKFRTTMIRKAPRFVLCEVASVLHGVIIPEKNYKRMQERVKE